MKLKRYSAILNLGQVDDEGVIYGVLSHDNITDDQKRPWPSVIVVPIHLYEQNGKPDQISVAFAFGKEPAIMPGNEFPDEHEDVILEAVE